MYCYIHDTSKRSKVGDVKAFRSKVSPLETYTIFTIITIRFLSQFYLGIRISLCFYLGYRWYSFWLLYQ